MGHRVQVPRLWRVHESPRVMTVPLFVLSIGAIFSGWLGYELFVGHDMARFWGDAIFICRPITPGHGKCPSCSPMGQVIANRSGQQRGRFGGTILCRLDRHACQDQPVVSPVSCAVFQ